MSILLPILINIIITTILAYLIAKNVYISKQNKIIKQAKIRAKAIEKEADIYFQDKKIKIKEEQINLQNKYENKILELEKMELNIKNDRKMLDEEIKQCKIEQKNNTILKRETNIIKEKYFIKKEELINALLNYTSLSKQEAKSILFDNLKHDLNIEKANYIRKCEQEAKENAISKANYILALATSRYAGEYGSEKLINVVYLPNDDMKGRIIGKDGRNIKSLEMITGVDIIIDDTPNVIILSSFNLYRREIALNTINKLIEDGRIQPTKIEELYKKCVDEMESNILKDGENTILDLNLGYMHPELVKLVGKLKYRASYGQNMLSHSIEVAHIAGLIASELNGNIELARRAGLLHDIGKALTYDTNSNHVSIGYELANKYNEHPVVINTILAHHGNEEIKSIECAAVCAADSISGARPGARKEVLQNYLQRMQNLENIASNYLGVKQAYAIHAGREIRVIVKSDEISDKEVIVMARDIKKNIESNLQYPGEIKINVIREFRSIEYAK